MGNCSSNNCNPCGPSESAINQLATKAAAYARQANAYSIDARNAFIEFNALYLGALAAPPTTDNEGNPLQVGALYWDTSSNLLYVWNGVAWGVTSNFNDLTPFFATGTMTARNLVTRMADSVKATDFGADPTGATNSAVAIQNAINFAQSRGNRTFVDLCGFNYLINSPLLISGNECGIGNGKLTAAIPFLPDGSGSIAMLRLTSGIRKTIFNITLDCNFSANGIEQESSGGFANLYFNVEIQEALGCGIKIEGGADQRVSHCLISQSQFIAAKRTGVGIALYNGDAKIHNSIIRYWGKCLEITGSTNLITDCHFYNGNSGIDFPLTDTINIEINGGFRNTIANCYIDKGLCVLKNGTSTQGGGFNSNWVGNKYLVASAPYYQTAIFVFDAESTANKSFPREFVHVAASPTLPVEFTNVPFIKFNGSFGGSWDSYCTQMQANLTASGAMLNSNGDNRFETIVDKPKYFQTLDGTGIVWSSNNVVSAENPSTTWNAKEILDLCNDIRTRTAGAGTSGTGSNSIEGSRTSTSGIAANLFFIDRRGTNNYTTDDTANGYIVHRLYSAAGTSPNSLAVALSVPGSAVETELTRWTDSAFRPGVHSTYDLGVTGTFAWDNVYATGVIGPSDEKLKSEISEVDDAAIRAWGKIAYKQFKYNNAVSKKGSLARTHIGLIAQEIKQVFESEGVDPFKYGILCYNEWPDVFEKIKDESGNVIDVVQTQKAGNQYSVRYHEAAYLEAAYQRKMLQEILSKL
jgi:hypothetical protein